MRRKDCPAVEAPQVIAAHPEVFGETLGGEVIDCFREAAHCFMPLDGMVIPFEPGSMDLRRVEFLYCSSPRGCPQRSESSRRHDDVSLLK